MSANLIVLATLLWGLAGVLGIAGRALNLGRALLAAGAVVLLAGVVLALPEGTPPLQLGLVFTAPVTFHLTPEACWLAAFGLVAAALAAGLGSPLARGRLWVTGAAVTLLGALGVFGLSEGAAFLIAWELMSLGGALMVLGERETDRQGGAILFMLTLLELGAVCLLAAILWLGSAAGNLDFTHFAAAGAGLSPTARYVVGLLLIIGFGAKLGLLPFYEWFPGVYGRASGATGMILSGVVLNAAYFALSRALVTWLPGTAGDGFAPGLTPLAPAVLTAIPVTTNPG